MAASGSAPEFAEAAARRFTGAEHEALRTVALAAAVAGAPEASKLVRAYAELCATTFAAPVPLAWPRRTAPGRLRIVTLLPRQASDGARRAVAALLTPVAAGCELQFATVGPRVPDVVAMVGLAAAQVAELPPSPGAAVAKALVNRDPDVLVDMTGLAAAAGPFLAQRAAREIWAVAIAPGSHVPPLVDRILTDPEQIVAAMASMPAAIASKAQCLVPAATLAAWWETAVRAHQRGDGTAAREGYAKVLEAQPDYAPAHYLMGMLARDAGDVAAARRSFDSALAAAPGYLDARLAAARAATELRDFDAAISICTDGLARAPTRVALWRALGLAHLSQQSGEAAAAAFERALALEPGDGDTHYNLGVALQMTRLPTATRAYRQALALSPGLHAANFNLGVLHQGESDHAAAIAAYEATLRADPRHGAAYKNLGEVLFAAGRFDAWRENFRRFEANCPRSLALAIQALEVLQWHGDFAGVSRYLDGLNSDVYQADDERALVDCLEELLYLLLFFDVEPDLPYRLARTYDTAARHVYGEPLPRPAVRRQGRLRIGYLSADLRNHVMGKMIWQAVRHHDRSRFDIGFYSLSETADDWTRRFRGVGDRFTTIAGLAERDAAQRLAADDLDILVDLSTHTKGAKPGIFALKPARVQITHVASAGTVGLSAIDFKLTDGHADIPASQAFQIETMLPMAGCVYPYRHVAPAAGHPFRREQLGVPAEAIVIGAFVGALKLSRRCLALWREVLERIPRSYLAFSPVDAAQRGLYRQIAAAAGISAERLVFVAQGRSDEENQARYELVDFVLDPLPFGGVNGTLEALDMGVPVVTLVGTRHGERTSFSILANLGVIATVANSAPEYVEIAVRLATDQGFVADVRTAIRNGIAASTLTDMPRHTRALEAAYEEALRLKWPEALVR
jgi:predicted O-linked N-acetylglucosamine transferase (SPINDLY family)